jgi:hypothetical protein
VNVRRKNGKNSIIFVSKMYLYEKTLVGGWLRSNDKDMDFIQLSHMPPPNTRVTYFESLVSVYTT